MMDNTGASCYVYAKASGMVAKAFTGPRLAKLFSIHNLQELWHTLFTEEMPVVPQGLLARAIEVKAVKQFHKDFKKLMECYSQPADVLKQLIRFYDYENIKTIGAALAQGKTAMPELVDISPYNIIDYSKWPDIRLMTAGSVLAWYNTVPTVHQQQELDSKLDVQYLRDLFAAAEKLPAEEREPVKELFTEYYSMRNMIWAMRLKVYYNMDAEKIASRIAFLDPRAGKTDILAGKALKILNKNPENIEDWKNWKYASLLNPYEPGIPWKLNPSFVEEKANALFYQKANRAFHKYPFTTMVLVSFFFIKSSELDCIRTATEAIRLNVTEEEMAKIAGVDNKR
ncbi:MAG: V-type ATPase subunit [Treponema sp.]|nr:V-type ATPase subunit [Treponema sp.]